MNENLTQRFEMLMKPSDKRLLDDAAERLSCSVAQVLRLGGVNLASAIVNLGKEDRVTSRDPEGEN